MSPDEIEAHALALPRSERAHLAEVLLASLRQSDEATIKTAERRFDEIRSGAATGIPADEVFARIRARPVR
jgi:putative addiction module component (TIGR02574 family)